MDLLDRLGLERPIVQAGMGGGIATADLAAALATWHTFGLDCITVGSSDTAPADVDAAANAGMSHDHDHPEAHRRTAPCPH